jgi:hypothetical protein
VFISPDANLYLKPSLAELFAGELCISGSATSDERCVVRNPPPGTYWIAVHNYQGSAPDALDHHVLAVAVIEDNNGDGLTVIAPEAGLPGEPFALVAEWDRSMNAGDIHYALVNIGSTSDKSDDIGSTLLRLDRIESDFTVTVDRTAVVASQALLYTWNIAAVRTDEPARNYRISVDIPPPYRVNGIDGEPVIATQNAVWEFTQVPGAPPRSGSIRVVGDFADAADSLAERLVADCPSRGRARRPRPPARPGAGGRRAARRRGPHGAWRTPPPRRRG